MCGLIYINFTITDQHLLVPYLPLLMIMLLMIWQRMYNLVIFIMLLVTYNDFNSFYHFNLLSHSTKLLISAADSSSFPSPLQLTNSTLIGWTSSNSKSFPCFPTWSFFLPVFPPSIPCRAADWLFLTSVLCRDHVMLVVKQHLMHLHFCLKFTFDGITTLGKK